MGTSEERRNIYKPKVLTCYHIAYWRALVRLGPGHRSMPGLRRYETHITKERRITYMQITKNVGMLLLSVWLILWGLSSFIPALAGLGVVWAILAIVAGIFILLQR